MTVDDENPDDGLEDDPSTGSVPDPDDRLWRHPSELGRALAASVNPRSPRAHAVEGRLVGVALLGGVIGALLAVGVTAWSGGVGTTSANEGGNPTVSQPQLLAGTTALGTSLNGLVGRTAPSVVALAVRGGSSPDATGSGVVVGPGNLVLTARRLLRSRSTVTARAASGREEPATVVGEDVDSGLALLRVGGPALVPLALTATSIVNPGDMAVLIGRDADESSSSTTSTSRAGSTTRTALPAHVLVGEIRSIDGDPVLAGVPVLGMVEADVPLEDGDLGAALIDGRGQLIGVTVAADEAQGSAALATPADVAQAVAAELASSGQLTHGWLGVEGGDASADTARVLGLSGGAIVTDVKTNSPASAAGVRVGDVVSALDGRDVSTMARLRALLRLRHPGDRVTMVLSRRDETRTIQVVLGPPATTGS